MRTLTFRSFLIIALSLTISTGGAETGYPINNDGISKIDFYPQTPQGGLFKSLYSNKSPLGDLGVDLSKNTFEPVSLLMQPRKAKRAQKKQDAKEKKKKNAIKDSSKQAQKRSYEIQSPEVQARMKQNKKDTAARDKARKKNNKARTKKGAKKYR
jgi:hypothetical protein